MEDIPQPSAEPYSTGGQVRIYIGSDDPDARYHNLVCEITEVLTDDLNTDTGRELDGYSSTLQAIGTGENYRSRSDTTTSSQQTSNQ